MQARIMPRVEIAMTAKWATAKKIKCGRSSAERARRVGVNRGYFGAARSLLLNARR